MMTQRTGMIMVLCSMLSACAEVKETGRAIGHGTRDVARGIGHGTRAAAKGIGHGFRDGAREIGHGFRDAVDGDGGRSGNSGQ